jgi:hypothetical protein
MDYRNTLFLPEVDARTTCRHGTTVMSLRHGGEESSAYQPYPDHEEDAKQTRWGREVMAIVVVLRSLGSHSLALEGVGRLH